jgi:hypothetical protein
MVLPRIVRPRIVHIHFHSRGLFVGELKSAMLRKARDCGPRGGRFSFEIILPRFLRTLSLWCWAAIYAVVGFSSAAQEGPRYTSFEGGSKTGSAAGELFLPFARDIYEMDFEQSPSDVMTQAHYSGRSASGSTTQPGVIPLSISKEGGGSALKWHSKILRPRHGGKQSGK